MLGLCVPSGIRGLQQRWRQGLVPEEFVTICACAAGCATHGRESFANGCTTIGFDPDRAYAVVPRCMVVGTECRDTNLTASAISVQLCCGRGPGQVSLSPCLDGGGDCGD